jgi:hypothetical protein
MIEKVDNRRDSWFLVMCTTIWRFVWSDSLDGRPDRGLFKGVLRFLRC